jgi:hypothetical protein
MASLLKAAVATEHSLEFCNLGKNCNCEFCHNSYSIGDDTGSNDCVLLKGLSEAKDLALISGPETVCLQFHLYLNHIMSYHYWQASFCVLQYFIVFSCALSSLFSRGI